VWAGFFNVGQLTTSVNGAVTRTRDYDATGGIARDDALIGNARHVTATLRNEGNQVAALTYEPHTLAVGTALDPWSYNAAGMLYAMPGLVTSIDYEADGQTKEIAYANGVVTRFTYSPERRRLTHIGTIAPDGVTALMDYAYTRDAAGRMTRIDGLTPSESWIYSHDDLDQLLTAGNLGETFTCPGAGFARPYAPLNVGKSSARHLDESCYAPSEPAMAGFPISSRERTDASHFNGLMADMRGAFGRPAASNRVPSPTLRPTALESADKILRCSRKTNCPASTLDCHVVHSCCSIRNFSMRE
tara:strand:- start:29074 stop:29979 length:906 start_codon:yes stop_codon:yes gene_type:complete